MATTPPSAARNERTKPPVATIGTKSDRKTTTMITSESPTTTSR